MARRGRSRGRTYRFAALLPLALANIAFATSIAHATEWTNTYNMRTFSDLGAAQVDVMFSSMLEDQIYMRKLKEAMQARAKAPTTDAAPAKSAAPAFKYPLDATDFKPAGKRTVPARLAASSQSPEERAQLVEMFTQIRQTIEASPEVRKNNLATAVTVLLGSSIQVVSRRQLDDAESVALLRAVNDAIVGTPNFKAMTDGQRTDAYDALLITGGLIAALDASAQESKDPAVAARADELARGALARFRLTDPTSSRPDATLAATSGRADGTGNPTPTRGTSSGMLDGIYMGLATGLVTDTVGTIDFGVSKTYVTFYPDGKVYRRVPEGGLEGWDRERAEAATPDLWGNYRPVGPGRWEIHWNQSARVSLVEREQDGLRYEDRMVFPVATCEGLVLEGVYARRSWKESQDPYSIAFNAAGQFVDDRLIGSLAYENLALPDSRTIAAGVGRYRVGRNTLHLEYQDGRRVPVEMHVRLDEVAKRPVPAIYVNGWELVHVR